MSPRKSYLKSHLKRSFKRSLPPKKEKSLKEVVVIKENISQDKLVNECLYEVTGVGSSEEER